MDAPAADRVEIVVIDENWIDMLLADRVSDPPAGSEAHGAQWRVETCGLIEHFDPRRTPPQAENGISLLVKVAGGRRSYSILFDVGLTAPVMKHNFDALNEDPDTIDYVVISHGHPDHYGGIYGLLERRSRPVPLATHPDAFLPRYAVMPDGRISPFYNAAFETEQLTRAGARIALSRDPVYLAPGVLTTGEIPRKVEFEGPKLGNAPPTPGLYQLSPDHKMRTDEVWDEQGLVIRVRNRGLIVITGCAHAGVLNTIARAHELVGEEPVIAVMGGFHLGFPTTPRENVQKTLDGFRAVGVQLVVPMHCSGLATHRLFSAELGSAYVQPAVGSHLFFDGGSSGP